MKLKLSWFRKSSENSLAPDKTTDIEEQHEIDPKIPREAVYQTFRGRPGPCPKCGSALHQSRQTYIVSTGTGGQAADSFMVGGNFGWFCESCSVVVINTGTLGEMLSFRKSNWDVGSEAIVLGIVDLDAIPANKRHAPIGDPGNPIPLVRFSNLPMKQSKKTKSKKRQKTRKRRK